MASPQPWSRVRHWLADLAQEIAAALQDGSLPDLRDDRVWITSDIARGCWTGLRHRLAIGTPLPRLGLAIAGHRRSHSGRCGPRSASSTAIAAGALRGVSPESRARALAVDCRCRCRRGDLLLSLQRADLKTTEDIAARSAGMLREPAVFPKRRRLAQLVACAVTPFVMAVAVFTVIELRTRARTGNPQSYALSASVQQLVAFDRKGEANLTPKEKEQRDAIEIYIAEHLREAAEEQAAYARAFPNINNAARDFKLAEQAITRHPQRTPAEIERADEVATPCWRGRRAA